MSKFTSIITTLTLVATIAAMPGSAQARGNGGPASAHRGCMSNNGIPLDDGQSVLVDGETVSCNDGTVCHSKPGQITYCYVNVQAESISTTGSNTGGKNTTGKHPVVQRANTTKKAANATR